MLEEAANGELPVHGQNIDAADAQPSNVYITALDDQGVDRNLPDGKSLLKV